MGIPRLPMALFRAILVFVSVLLCLAVASAGEDEWLEQTASAQHSFQSLCQHLVDGNPQNCNADSDCPGAHHACWKCGTEGINKGKLWVDHKEYDCEHDRTQPMCEDWDATLKGIKMLPTPDEGYHYAECNGESGTEECW